MSLLATASQLTNQLIKLTLWAVLEQQMSPQLVKKSPTFYGTCTFITAFTTACHLALSWAQQISCPILVVEREFSVVRNVRTGPGDHLIPNPQTEGPPFVSCPQLLIQDIRSYPPYRDTVSSIRKQTSTTSR
jgi:hypothetical protein